MSGPRSLLIMPANREDMLTKAPNYGADALANSRHQPVNSRGALSSKVTFL